MNRGRASDLVLRVIGLLGLSVHQLPHRHLLILFISTKWPVLPTTGFVPLGDSVTGNLKSLVQPAISLGALLAASVMRMIALGGCWRNWCASTDGGAREGALQPRGGDAACGAQTRWCR